MSAREKKFISIPTKTKRAESKRKNSFINPIVMALLQLPLLLSSRSVTNIFISRFHQSLSISSCKPTTLPAYFNYRQRSTSITSHVATTLTSTCTPNKGRNNLEVNLQNDNLSPKHYLLLKKVPIVICAAKRFQYESPGFCCDNGSIGLSSYNMPIELHNLFLGDSKECQHFRTYSRAYNNMFAFSSLGVHYDRQLAQRNHGIYTFKVQGQIYHFIDDLIPSNRKPKIYNYIFMITKMS
ncbi:hypothetical protein H5410_023921 [Solanum commersonii]|uniref:Uncharacterized protein n=1 Tax=Solanum commersonii TaxID=4109 RepID=A0A9J5ZKJ4_SOLCO|nr:hypothetical protein H5410_023921 [Solanum commersonii]